MPLELYFVIVTVTLVAFGSLFAILSYKTIQNLQSQVQSLTEKMTNLAAAKDFQTYSNLTTLNQNRTQNQSEIPVALDDASVAHAIAQRYAESGIDPGFAYARDDTDPMEDFGGMKEFMGLKD